MTAPGGRVALAGTFRLGRGRSEATDEAMSAMAAASRAEDGCEVYSYAFDMDDPALVRVFEVWRDPMAFAAHREAAHLTAWRALWPGLGIVEARLTAYQLAGERAV